MANILNDAALPETAESFGAWQDISTAPRDGTVVRLFDTGVNADGWFVDGEWKFLDVLHGDEATINGWVQGYGPTHWMPLPPPPSSKRRMMKMSETKIPGIKCKHATVTPVCRVNKGPDALDEALGHLRQEYLEMTSLEANAFADFNFVLTVDRPRGDNDSPLPMVSVPESLFSEMMQHLPDDFETKFREYLRSLRGTGDG